MKTITINVSEPVYAAYKERARRSDRTASELIREAMELYKSSWSKNEHSVLDLPPIQVGEVIKPLSADDDLLAEMGNGNRD